MSFTRPVRAIVVDASTMVEVLGGNREWVDRMSEWQDADAMLLAPPHFRSEMANALLRSVRLDALDVVSRLQQLFEAGVDLVDRGFSGLYDAVELAERHGLSVYDALYLSLAIEVDGELATSDRALVRAAEAELVPVVS